MPGAFQRSLEHRTVPPLTAPRIVGIILHLTIPLVAYHVLYQDQNIFIQKIGDAMVLQEGTMSDVSLLSPDRKLLYLLLATFYGVRWSLAMVIMLSEVSMLNSIMVGFLHLIFLNMAWIVGSVTVGNKGVLTARDYIAAALHIVGGYLQQGSELQRWMFKKDPKNKGLLHTSGLFSLARGINHTGNVMRESGQILISPNIPMVIFILSGAYFHVMKIVPETEKHMRKKYGEKYEDYEKKTPYMFIPGLY